MRFCERVCVTVRCRGVRLRSCGFDWDALLYTRPSSPSGGHGIASALRRDEVELRADVGAAALMEETEYVKEGGQRERPLGTRGGAR